MSWWRTPLFGTARPAQATPVHVRCRRLVMQSWFEALRWGPGVLAALLSGTMWGLWVVTVWRFPAPAGAKRWEGVIPAGCGIAASVAVVFFVTGLVIPVGYRWLFDLVEWHGRQRPRRMPRWGRRAVSGVAIAVCAGIAFAFAKDRVVAMALTVIFGLQAGAALVGASFGRRVSSVVVCARCEYAMGSWGAAPERCPECGQYWKRAWKAKFGTRRLALGWFALGTAMVLGAGVVMLVWRP